MSNPIPAKTLPKLTLPVAVTIPETTKINPAMISMGLIVRPFLSTEIMKVKAYLWFSVNRFIKEELVFSFDADVPEWTNGIDSRHLSDECSAECDD